MKHIFSFYYSQIGGDLSSSICIIKSDHSLFHRMSIVLRMQKGDKLILFNGRGFFCTCQLIEINKNSVSLQVLKEDILSVSGRKVTVYTPMLDIDYLKSVFFIAAQQGIDKIVLVSTEKSRKELYSDRESQKLSAALVSGCEQGQQYYLPKWNEKEVINFSFLLDSSYISTCYTFFEYGKCNILHMAHSISCTKEIVNLFCGPEGGFSEKEVSQLQQAQNHFLVHLSKSVLRSVDVLQFGITFVASLI